MSQKIGKNSFQASQETSKRPKDKKSVQSVLKIELPKSNSEAWSIKVNFSITVDNHHQNVRVSCEFVEVFTSYERALRKFDSKNFTEKSYESQ